ncbi:protein-L-isoaspartate(D-aspartate) O-methyltransferase [Oceanibium sediminis]|uniref:protein-L-isoaspartate(D-aspartate) O-methyltransferase n=1 Tax=Oceanibium sediminis TaxID=2026339 RepID=UPI000DD4E79D|nr:protein-L-isoaspartate(D-aspartate) O-methyltransferase [Oceanibium sediminis]
MNIDTEAQARMQFVLALRARGVTDHAVLTAMEATPRDRFLDGVFKARAWEDVALPIGGGQTISQPSVVGLMTQALEVNKRCKVLEIGTGSGYQAAVLSHLARRVYTTERHRHLARSAEAVLRSLDRANVTVMPVDGAYGLPEQSPFDRILLTAAAEDPPAPLLAQLSVGGIMVLPVGQSDSVQTLLKVVKTEAGLDYEAMGEVRFVPLIEGMAED